MAQSFAPADAMTAPFQLTASMHRDVYPAVEWIRPNLSAKGKVVLVVGAGGGLGYVSSSMFLVKKNGLQY
jgi:hypothetical protein